MIYALSLHGRLPSAGPRSGSQNGRRRGRARERAGGGEGRGAGEAAAEGPRPAKRRARGEGGKTEPPEASRPPEHTRGLTARGLQHQGRSRGARNGDWRSEEHTSELQSRQYLVCRLLLEKKNSRQTTR